MIPCQRFVSAKSLPGEPMGGNLFMHIILNLGLNSPDRRLSWFSKAQSLIDKALICQ